MPEMTLLQIAALYVALNAILTVVLAINVGLARHKAKITIGDGGDPALQRAIRAHGNNVEYVPLALLLLVTLALMQTSAVVIHFVGATLTVGRIAHGIGLSRVSGISLGRRLGAALTMLAIVVAIVALLMKVFA